MTWEKRLTVQGIVVPPSHRPARFVAVEVVRWDTGLRVYLCREPVDMRKQIGGLALLVQEAMELNPFEEAVFMFGNRQRDKVKMLFWERNGFVVWYKRLEKERFKWPSRLDDDTLSLTGQELNLAARRL